MDIQLYTIHGCSKCWNARKHLEKHNFSFEEFNIIHEKQSFDSVKSTIETFGLPLLLLNKQILDYNEIMELGNQQKEVYFSE